ncbi:hypothetical protein KIPB_011182, partial [Kipferlia bialata]
IPVSSGNPFAPQPESDSPRASVSGSSASPETAEDREVEVKGESDRCYMPAYQVAPVSLDDPRIRVHLSTLWEAGGRGDFEVFEITHGRWDRFTERTPPEFRAAGWHGTSMRNVHRVFAHGGVTNFYRGIIGQEYGAGIYMGKTPQLSYSCDKDVARSRCMLLHFYDTREATHQDPIVLPKDDSFALKWVFFFR